MLLRLSDVRAFCASAAIAVLAGCSSSVPSTPNALETSSRASSAVALAVPRDSVSKAARLSLARPRGARPARSWFSRPISQSVFLADAANGVVDIMDFDSGEQTGEIAGLSSPEGLATDASANLYVADTLAQTIAIYAFPYSGNPTVLNDTGYFPVGVHVAASGDIYVANICSGSGNSCRGAGNTIVYKSGSPTPTPLTGGPGRAYFVATDWAGNVWVDGQVSSTDPTAEIGYFSAANHTFVPVGIAFAFPGGIAFDRAGNLLLDDQAGAPNGASILNIYPPGATSPSSTIVLQDNGDDIIDIALGTARARLFAPDYYSGTASIITYPAGATVNALVPATIGELDAVAVTPATLP